MLLRFQKSSKNKKIFVQSASRLGFNTNRGFTLIEFLVASSLGVVVLLAIGTTYTITNTMKRNSESRLSAQQDLRNAAEMIIRDARMAGSFGCFNMGNLAQKAFLGVNGGTNGLKLELDNENFSGVSIADADSVRSAFEKNGFQLLNNPLIFAYGINPVPLSAAATISSQEMIDWSEKGGRIALASCFKMEIENVTAHRGNVRIGGAMPMQNTSFNDHTIFYPPQTTVSQVHVNAYAIGRIDGIDGIGSRGLYRFSLDANGAWEGPQLLVANIQSMDMKPTYAGCGDDSTEATFSDSYINLKNNPNMKRVSPMPALLNVTLQLSDDDQTHGHFNEYLITASVRGGNVCAGL